MDFGAKEAPDNGWHRNESGPFVGMPADRLSEWDFGPSPKCLIYLVGAQGLEPWTR
jgi:hypothetical protein